MKRISLLLVFPLQLFAQGKYQLEGQLSQAPDSTTVELAFAHSAAPSLKTIVKNGRFSFTGEVDGPTESLLAVTPPGGRTEIKLFYLDAGTTRLCSDSSIRQATFYNSVINDQYDQFREFTATHANLPSDEMHRQFVVAWPSSFFSLVALREFATHQLSDLTKVEQLYATLSPAVRKTRAAADFENWMTKTKALSAGATAPDLEAKDTNGKTVKLSEFKGSYVLLHFWASWCGACRNESPTFLETYKQYKDKGLKVLYVSVDDLEHDDAWRKAITEDSVGNFVNIRADQGEIFSKFNIRSIPLNFVIDPNGKIVTIEIGDAAITKTIAAVYSKK